MRYVVVAVSLLGLAGCVNRGPSITEFVAQQCGSQGLSPHDAKLAPYYTCVRDEAAKYGDGPQLAYLLSQMVVIYKQADAGTLSPDETQAAVAKVKLEAFQMDQQNEFMVGQQIQTANAAFR
jgi:hypothetical protein